MHYDPAQSSNSALMVDLNDFLDSSVFGAAEPSAPAQPSTTTPASSASMSSHSSADPLSPRSPFTGAAGRVNTTASSSVASVTPIHGQKVRLDSTPEWAIAALHNASGSRATSPSNTSTVTMTPSYASAQPLASSLPAPSPFTSFFGASASEVFTPSVSTLLSPGVGMTHSPSDMASPESFYGYSASVGSGYTGMGGGAIATSSSMSRPPTHSHSYTALSPLNDGSTRPARPSLVARTGSFNKARGSGISASRPYLHQRARTNSGTAGEPAARPEFTTYQRPMPALPAAARSSAMGGSVSQPARASLPQDMLHPDMQKLAQSNFGTFASAAARAMANVNQGASAAHSPAIAGALASTSVDYAFLEEFDRHFARDTQTRADFVAEDPLEVSMWKVFQKAKALLPMAERLENASWRRSGMKLKAQREGKSKQAETQGEAKGNKAQVGQRPAGKSSGPPRGAGRTDAGRSGFPRGAPGSPDISMDVDLEDYTDETQDQFAPLESKDGSLRERRGREMHSKRSRSRSTSRAALDVVAMDWRAPSRSRSRAMTNELRMSAPSGPALDFSVALSHNNGGGGAVSASSIDSWLSSTSAGIPQGNQLAAIENTLNQLMNLQNVPPSGENGAASSNGGGNGAGGAGNSQSLAFQQLQHIADQVQTRTSTTSNPYATATALAGHHTKHMPNMNSSSLTMTLLGGKPAAAQAAQSDIYDFFNQDAAASQNFDQPANHDLTALLAMINDTGSTSNDTTAPDASNNKFLHSIDPSQLSASVSSTSSANNASQFDSLFTPANSATPSTNSAGNTPKPRGAGANSDETTQCLNCGTTKTPLWRRDTDGQPLCNACGLFRNLHGTNRPAKLNTGIIKKRNRAKNGSTPKDTNTTNTSINSGRRQSASSASSMNNRRFNLAAAAAANNAANNAFN